MVTTNSSWWSSGNLLADSHPILVPAHHLHILNSWPCRWLWLQLWLFEFIQMCECYIWADLTHPLTPTTLYRGKLECFWWQHHGAPSFTLGNSGEAHATWKKTHSAHLYHYVQISMVLLYCYTLSSICTWKYEYTCTWMYTCVHLIQVKKI
jgi:hypothetical protein